MRTEEATVLLHAGRAGRQPSEVTTTGGYGNQQPGCCADEHGLLPIRDQQSKQPNCAEKTHQTDRHQDIRFHSSHLLY